MHAGPGSLPPLPPHQRLPAQSFTVPTSPSDLHSPSTATPPLQPPNIHTPTHYTMRSSSFAYTRVWLISSMCCGPASSALALALWKWMTPSVTVQPRCRQHSSLGDEAAAAAGQKHHSRASAGGRAPQQHCQPPAKVPSARVNHSPSSSATSFSSGPTRRQAGPAAHICTSTHTPSLTVDPTARAPALRSPLPPLSS